MKTTAAGISAVAMMLAGVAVTHFLYAMNEDGNLLNQRLFVFVLIAALISTFLFVVCRRVLSRSIHAALFGTALSYVAWLAILMTEPSTLMWLPVIVLFGIPFTLPVLLGSWCASAKVCSLLRPAQQAVAADRPKTGAG
jgi:hypothetical protein